MSIQMKAGFGRTDITPSYSVPLRGYGDTKGRMSKVNLDPLYATCVAVSDGTNIALFYHMDMTNVPTASVHNCRKAIHAKYGIPEENIYFTGTHNHSAPDYSCPMDCITRFLAEMEEQAILAADEAIADLEDAELYAGKGKTDGLNFVRRYLLSDGTYGGDNFGDFKKNFIVEHESEVDNTMQVIRWKRATKKDIIMVNWQAHPHRTGGFRKFDLSSDVIHYFRLAVEKLYHFAYFQGCAGNINTNSRIPAENMHRTPDYYADENHDYKTHGRCLAKACFDILPTLRKLRGGEIHAVTAQVHGKVNHDWDHRVPDAKKALELWTAGKSDEGKALAKELGFNSIYHAQAVTQKVKLPETMDIPVGGVAFGDFALVGAPNELYDTTGMYVKATSPFEMTFVCGYTNGDNYGGYLPTIKAFAHGGYGCDTCRFSAGIAENMADTLIDCLVRLYQKK